MNKIKFARLEAGYTQTQLCKMVKTSPKKLVEMERGNTDRVTKILMLRLSKVLNISVKELFFEDVEEFEEVTEN